MNWPDRTPNLPDDCAAANWALSTQLPAYEHAAKWRALKETKWLIFLDVDEFLVPVQHHLLSEILEKYEGYPGIEITSDYFDAAQITFPKKDLLITSVELTNKPLQKIQTSVIKMIIRPEDHTFFTWPPFQCHFMDGRAPARMNKGELRINKYVNRFNGILKFEHQKDKLHIDHRLLSEVQLKEALEFGYEIEDNEKAIFQFVPELRKKMGMETGWNW
jgi:hypothetical protein